MFGVLAQKIMGAINEAKEELSKEEFEELLDGLEMEIEEMRGE